jgi:FkbM family methyltransferase
MYDISQYRNEVLEVLNKTGNHYDTKIINLKRLNNDIQYHRWLHPFQGDWEVDYLFTEEILSNLNKIIKPGTSVIDIGAQTGNMSVAYSLFADKVLSFEPNPATFEVLEKNSILNKKIQPYNYAVSDLEGPLTFHYSDNGFCNGGFAVRTHRGIGVTGHKIPIDVYAVRLIEFLNEIEFDLSSLSLIKIDAEGHDKEIIKTITPILQEYKPVLITEVYNGLDVDEVKDLIDSINNAGYKAYDEKVNNLNIDNLGEEIKSIGDIDISSGHNLICVYDS